MLEGFNDYRSPFDTDSAEALKAGNVDHYNWCLYRDNYANGYSELNEEQQQAYFQAILSTVTLDNPPPAKDLYRIWMKTEPSRSLDYPPTALWTALCLTGAIAAGIFGGWLAFLITAGILIVIFGLAFLGTL